MRIKVNPASLTNLGFIENELVKSVSQNICLILTTRKGSVPMYREFGMDWTMLDKPIPAARPLLQVAVKEAIEEFEPRAKVINIKFTENPSVPGQLIPEVEVEISE